MLRNLTGHFLGLILLGLTFGVAQSNADDLNVAILQKQILEVVQQTAPAIVEISKSGSLFSGVIVSPEGHVFTAGHTVVPNQRYNIMLPDGRRLKGRSLGSCEQMRGERVDIGLIMIDDAKNLPFAKIGNSSSLQVNQPCLSISYPGGQREVREPMVRFGYISRTGSRRSMIQSTALMEPGDSGGPLFDLDGRVIGIHSRISPEIHQNFDVPIDVYKDYWDQLNVPSVFQTQDGKQLPKLGLYGEDYPEKNGIRILEVSEGGIAKSIGIKPEDYLTRVNGSAVSRLPELQTALQSVLKDKPETVSVKVQRGEQELEFQFPSIRLVCPKAARFSGLDPVEPSRAVTFPQLASFPKAFASEEAKWDDQCCTISCTTSGEKSSLMGIYIAGTSLIVAKNSILKDEPVTVSGGKKIELKVVARDDANDLVLLSSPETNLTGVSFTNTLKPDNAFRGKFLLSPDPNGDGFTSVMSSTQFNSPRQVSRGFLGVRLEDHDKGGVILVQVDDGAAKRAGLQAGDVILQVNERIIRNRPEILNFLHSVDPKTNITAKVRRETTEFETEITLGAPPSDTGHAADLMEKSLRRDGFNKVISHDALVQPNACGGPVFDLDGKFVGMNIARHSRVRTFILPATVVRDFVEKHKP